MKYSEVKARILILKKHGFMKRPSWGFYECVYSLQGWHYRQCFANHDFLTFRSTDDLDLYLFEVYGQRMKTLLEYIIEDYTKKLF